MGLSITVGVLAESFNNQDWLESIQEEFRKANQYLHIAGLPAHVEPENLVAERLVSYKMYGYSGIHYLRRFAAHLRAGSIPTPVRKGQDPSSDKLLTEYYALCDWTVENSGIRLFNSGRAQGPSFNHLTFHSDADGFFLPIKFDGVLITYEEGEEYSNAIGSSQALKHECETLSEALGLPLDLDPECDEVWDIADCPKTEGPTWKRLGVESFTCLRLFHACQKSIENKAAVVLH